MYDELLERHKESDDKQNRIRDSFKHKIETLQGSLSREVDAGEGARTAVVRLKFSLLYLFFLVEDALRENLMGGISVGP
jgi:hypothetical protein